MSREGRDNNYRPSKKIRSARPDPLATRRLPRLHHEDSLSGISSESGLVVKPVSKPVKVDRRSSSLDRALTGYLKDQSVRKDYQVAEDSRLECQSTEDSDDST